MDAEGKARAGAAVEAARQAKNMSMQQLADRAGVDISVLRKLIRGDSWPWPSSRRRLEEALNWEPGRIAGIAQQKSSADPGQADLLDLSRLSTAERHEVLALYHRLLEKRAQDDPAV